MGYAIANKHDLYCQSVYSTFDYNIATPTQSYINAIEMKNLNVNVNVNKEKK